MRYNVFKILIFFNLLLVSCNIFAIQYAVIQKYKAKVYADKELTSPIGYISKGKKVKVGEVLREYGTVLPIAISGRIAYIKVDDLYLSASMQAKLDKNSKDSGLSRRSVVIIKEEHKENFFKNNYIGYSFRPFIYQGDWSTLSSNLGNTINTRGKAHYITFTHRSPYHDWHYGFDFGMNYLQQETLELGVYFFNLNIDYSLWKSTLVSVEAYASIGHSINSTIKETTANVQYTAQAFSLGYGVQVAILPSSPISFIVGFGTRNLSIYNLAVSQGAFTADTSTLPVKSITSKEFQISALYRF